MGSGGMVARGNGKNNTTVARFPRHLNSSIAVSKMNEVGSCVTGQCLPFFPRCILLRLSLHRAHRIEPFPSMARLCAKDARSCKGDYSPNELERAVVLRFLSEMNMSTAFSDIKNI